MKKTNILLALFASAFIATAKPQRAIVQTETPTNLFITATEYGQVQSNFFSLVAPYNISSAAFAYDAQSNCIVSVTASFHLTDTNKLNFMTNLVFLSDAKGFNVVGMGTNGATILPISVVERPRLRSIKAPLNLPKKP